MILFKQNKFEECQALVQLFKDDSKTLKDQFFIRILEEIEAKILIRQGKTTDALRKLDKLKLHGDSYYHDDLGFGKILGDIGDISFERGDLEQAEINYRRAKDHFAGHLYNLRFEFVSQNQN